MPNWRSFLARVIREEDIKVLRAHERTGRPLGDEEFLASLETDLGRILSARSPAQNPAAEFCMVSLEPENPAAEFCMVSLEPENSAAEFCMVSLEPENPAAEFCMVSLEPAMVSLEPEPMVSLEPAGWECECHERMASAFIDI